MSFGLGRRSRRIVIGIGAAMALSVGIAYATGSGGSTVIYACKLKNVGTIRLIEPGKSGLQGHCSNFETAISWNQQGPAGTAGPKGDTGPRGAPGAKGDTGPQGTPGAKGDTGPQGTPGAKGDTGPQGTPGAKGDTGTPGAKGDTGPQGTPGAKGDTGATGPQGPAGADGLAGYEIVQTSLATPPGFEAIGTQFCPGGKKMISGGWKNDDGTGNPAVGAYVTSSSPTADGNGWTGGLYNTPTSGVTITVTVWTVCVNPPASGFAARARHSRSSGLHLVKPGR